jgi:hypothetical protein
MLTPSVIDILERAKNLSADERASLIVALMTGTATESRPDRASVSAVDDFLLRKHAMNEIEEMIWEQQVSPQEAEN